MAKKVQTSQPVLLADVGQKLIATAVMHNAKSLEHATTIATHEEKMLAVQIRIARNLQESLETQKGLLDFLEEISNGVTLLNSQFTSWLRSTANAKAKSDDSGKAGQRYTGISGHERSLGDARSEANKVSPTRADLLLDHLLPVDTDAFLSRLACVKAKQTATPSVQATSNDASRKDVERVRLGVVSDGPKSMPPSKSRLHTQSAEGAPSAQVKRPTEPLPISPAKDNRSSQNLPAKSSSAPGKRLRRIKSKLLSRRRQSDGIKITRYSDFTIVEHGGNVNGGLIVRFHNQAWRVSDHNGGPTYPYANRASAEKGAIRMMKRLISGRPLRKPK